MADVFIVAANADAKHVAALTAHLAPASQSGGIRVMSSTALPPGGDREALLRSGILTSRALVLLVTADLLASREGQIALAAAVGSCERLVPVLLRACAWKATVLANAQLLPRDHQPIVSRADRDGAWVKVVEAISAKITEGTEVVPRGVAHLENELAEARRRRERLAKEAVPKAAVARVDAEILDLRRRLRERGQLTAGDTLSRDRYVLLERAGKGGFATVWRARDQQTDTEVAIKVLHGQFARDEMRRERFFRGARVMASLDHPGIVKVLVPEGHDRGFDFFVMELVTGGTLRDATLARRIAADEIPNLVRKVGEALGAAHEKGHIHRDVKPANILLAPRSEGGRTQVHNGAPGSLGGPVPRAPRLTDFDLVGGKQTTGGTRTGAMGSFVYAAPEAMERPQDADARADVYGLGMTAIFCYYGKDLPPSVMRDVGRVVKGLACSERVKAALLKAVEWEAEDRFSDVAAFCEALKAAASAPDEATQDLGDRPLSTAPRQSSEDTRLERKPGSSGIRGRAALAGSIVFAAWIAAALTIGTGWNKGNTGESAGPFAASVASGTTTAAVAPTSAAASSSLSASFAAPIEGGSCPAGMIKVPGDTFRMGSDSGDDDEKPAHAVIVRTFCVDKTEVTTEEYNTCVATKRCAAAGAETFCNGPRADRKRHPINCVTWHQATAYCAARNKRLPSEEEWEFAARGSDGRPYPWGAALPTKHACWNRGGTCAVGQHPGGNTALGLADMAGNVWEWTASWYCPYDPAKECSMTMRVYRGGSWGPSDASWLRSANRYGVLPSSANSVVGFRCARDFS